MRGRTLVAVLAVLVAAVVVAVVVIGGGDDEKKKDEQAAQPVPGTKTLPPQPFVPQQGLKEPPTVRVDGATPTPIVARNTAIDVNGVQVAGGQAYVANGSKPALTGPTLLAKPGGRVNIELDNQLVVPDDMQSPEDCAAGSERGEGDAKADAGKPQVTNFHFHGLRVTPKTRKIDGVRAIGDNVLIDLQPGKTRIEFDIPADHEQGTFWYHAHRHGCTDDQVARGLAGLMLIGDSRAELPPRFKDVETREMMLQSLQVVKAGDGYKIDPGHFWANALHRTVNAQVNPKLDIAPGETQLWRLANGSDGVWYEVSFVDGSNRPLGFTTVAQDGNTLTSSREESTHVLGPGNRVDILVEGPESGPAALKTMPFEQGNVNFPTDVLATVDVKGADTQPVEAPGRLKPLPPMPAQRGPNRTFTFNIGKAPPNGPPPFTINGQVFSLDQPPQATPTVNTWERWTIRNTSTEKHPFHIHQGDFIVRAVNGRRVNSGGQQDVVELPFQVNGKPGEIVFDMAFREEGDFVFHCHILDHEDLGMMARVSVTDGRDQ